MTPFERKSTLAGLIIGGGGLAIAGLQYATPAPPAFAPPTPVTVNVDTSKEEVNKESNLSKILVEKTLGRQISYVESIIGPAEEVSGTWRTYTVDSCPIWLNVDSENSIRGISLDVSEACTFEWRDMFHNMTSLESPDTTSIARFVDKFGLDHVQGCISLCGNSTGGGIFFLRKGSHADGWINVKVGFVNDTGAEIAFARKFGDLVDQNIDQYASMDLSVICDPREIAWARNTMGPVKIEYVEFGFDDSISFKYNDEKDCELQYLSALQG